MKLFHGSKKKAAAAAVAALVIAGSGSAFAYWTTTGNGVGTATTGDDTGVTLAQFGEVSGMVPGGSPKAIGFTITNGASTPQYITTVTVGISSVTTVPAGGDCDATDFSIPAPVVEINTDLGPGAHDYADTSATIQMINKLTNQDDCKGATVNLSFTAA